MGGQSPPGRACGWSRYLAGCGQQSTSFLHFQAPPSALIFRVLSESWRLLSPRLGRGANITNKKQPGNETWLAGTPIAAKE